MKVLSAGTEGCVNERIDWLFCDVSGPRATLRPDKACQFSITAAVRKLTNPLLVSALSNLTLVKSSGCPPRYCGSLLFYWCCLFLEISRIEC
jgi:hypothetical protein